MGFVAVLHIVGICFEISDTNRVSAQSRITDFGAVIIVGMAKLMEYIEKTQYRVDDVFFLKVLFRR